MVINRLRATKSTHSNSVEYWKARELQTVLGYSEWRNFEVAINRAKETCANNDREVQHHFVDLNSMITTGKGASRLVKDYILSRYACYLVAMNGDTSKREISEAQEYFAVQTRKSEIRAAIALAEKRINERDRLTENQKRLNAAAQNAGVKRFGTFQNAGYESMYDGLNTTEVKSYKDIPEKDALFDRIGEAELAAHNFRATQTKVRLENSCIDDEELAIEAHKETGKIVRETMLKLGGVAPEDLPIEPHIKQVKSDIRKFNKLRKSNASSSNAQQQLS